MASGKYFMGLVQLHGRSDVPQPSERPVNDETLKLAREGATQSKRTSWRHVKVSFILQPVSYIPGMSRYQQRQLAHTFTDSATRLSVMKHVHGVAVMLQAANGTSVTEYANPYTSNLPRYNDRVGSRLLSEKPGKAFRVCISIGEEFKIYTAKGLKIVVVALCQSPAAGKLVRRSQAWWIEVSGKDPEAEYVLECFTNGRDIKVKNQQVAFVMPQPAGQFGFTSPFAATEVDELQMTTRPRRVTGLVRRPTAPTMAASLYLSSVACSTGRR